MTASRRLTLALLLLLAPACIDRAASGQLGLPTAAPARASTAHVASATPTVTPSPTPSATPSAATTPPPGPGPRLLRARATQTTLTVDYSAPMRSGLACGQSGPLDGPAGAIDQAAGAAVRTPRSDDPVFEETLRSAAGASIGPDCASVTFTYARAAAPGTFAIIVRDVQDREGRPIDPAHAAAVVTIADEGHPTVLRYASAGDSVSVTFSEPMQKTGEGSGVTLAGNYRLDAGAPLVSVSCVDRGCREVRIDLAPGTLVPGTTHALRVANVVDRAGLDIIPDPIALTFVAR